MDSKMLYEMSQVEIEKVDPSTLVDINTVVIDKGLPHEEKILSFIQEIGNPYCFSSGGIPVCIRFCGEGNDLSQSLVNYFSMLKQK